MEESDPLARLVHQAAARVDHADCADECLLILQHKWISRPRQLLELSPDEWSRLALALPLGFSAALRNLLTASSEASSEADSATLQMRLFRRGVRFIRALFCDFAGVRRCKIFALSGLDPSVAIGLATAINGVSALADAPLSNSGLGPVGEVFLLPDSASVRFIDVYAPTHALMVCDIVERTRLPCELCPRHFLRKQIAALANLGLKMVVGVEHEFFLYPRGTTAENLLSRTSRSLYLQTNDINRFEKVLRRIIEALGKQSISVELFHTESAYNQIELVISYADALIAADNVIIFRETVCAIAEQHELEAVFLPKVLERTAVMPLPILRSARIWLEVACICTVHCGVATKTYFQILRSVGDSRQRHSRSWPAFWSTCQSYKLSSRQA